MSERYKVEQIQPGMELYSPVKSLTPLDNSEKSTHVTTICRSSVFWAMSDYCKGKGCKKLRSSRERRPERPGKVSGSLFD